MVSEIKSKYLMIRTLKRAKREIFCVMFHIKTN